MSIGKIKKSRLKNQDSRQRAHRARKIKGGKDDGAGRWEIDDGRWEIDDGRWTIDDGCLEVD